MILCIANVQIFDDRIIFQNVCLRCLQTYMAALYILQQCNAMFQILDFFLDLAVCPQLVTDGGDRIFLALREHVIPYELACTIRHPQCDGALFHRHQSSGLDVSQNNIIQRVQIRFSGRINAIHIASAPIVAGQFSLFDQCPQLRDGIRHAIHEIFILRQSSGMTEHLIIADVRVIFSYLKCHTKASICLCTGVQNLQYDLRTKILPVTVVAAVLLRTAQITQDTSAVFRIIRRLVQKIAVCTAVQDRIHNR